MESSSGQLTAVGEEESETIGLLDIPPEVRREIWRKAITCLDAVNQYVYLDCTAMASLSLVSASTGPLAALRPAVHPLHEQLTHSNTHHFLSADLQGVLQ